MCIIAWVLKIGLQWRCGWREGFLLFMVILSLIRRLPLFLYKRLTLLIFYPIFVSVCAEDDYR